MRTCLVPFYGSADITTRTQMQDHPENHTNHWVFTYTSWWFQPIWKICSSIGIISPRIGVKIKKYLSCYHLASRNHQFSASSRYFSGGVLKISPHFTILKWTHQPINLMWWHRKSAFTTTPELDSMVPSLLPRISYRNSSVFHGTNCSNVPINKLGLREGSIHIYIYMYKTCIYIFL